MSKLSPIVNSPRGRGELNFLKTVRQEGNDFFSVELKKDVVSNERITLSCCDAAPEFAVVASIAVFVDIETFDLSAGLQVYLHKKGYTVSESLGY